MAERRQMLPNAESVFRPKAPDVRTATAGKPDPLSGRGRHALVVARDGRTVWASDRLRPAQRGGVDVLAPQNACLVEGYVRVASEAQRARARIAVGVLNRMTELGMRKAQRVG